jgi:hypothetical protein
MAKKQLPTGRDYQGRHPAVVGLSVTAAAKALGVSRQMLHSGGAQTPHVPEGVPPVWRLAGRWMRLQAAYDLKKAVMASRGSCRDGA